MSIQILFILSRRVLPKMLRRQSKVILFYFDFRNIMLYNGIADVEGRT